MLDESEAPEDVGRQGRGGLSRGTRILDDAPESESESGSDICNEEDIW